MTSRHDQQPRKICDFGMTPVTSSSLVPNVNQQRVSHSFRRAQCSFQIRRSNESHTRADELRVRSRFATHGRDQQRTGNPPCSASHLNKEQRKRTQRRSATMFAVFLLCVLRDNLCLTPAMGCAHMDDHRACRVTSVHTLSTTTKED